MTHHNLFISDFHTVYNGIFRNSQSNKLKTASLILLRVMTSNKSGEDFPWQSQFK